MTVGLVCPPCGRGASSPPTRTSLPEAYLELGRLERLAGRYATAKRYLVEGLRLVRSAPETDAELLDALVQELAELPATDQ